MCVSYLQYIKHNCQTRSVMLSDIVPPELSTDVVEALCILNSIYIHIRESSTFQINLPVRYLKKHVSQDPVSTKSK